MRRTICFRNESKKETNKAEGFADDTTGLTLFEYDSLFAIKKILVDFGTFSGLQCNVDKTVLMQIGVIRQPSQAILDLGFTLVDKIKYLVWKSINHSQKFTKTSLKYMSR